MSFRTFVLPILVLVAGAIVLWLNITGQPASESAGLIFGIAGLALILTRMPAVMMLNRHTKNPHLSRRWGAYLYTYWFAPKRAERFQKRLVRAITKAEGL